MARPKNEAAHAATRQRILRAAAELFAERGFQGTGMAAICAAVEMSPGTLYRYFPSKDAIVLAFVDDELAESLASIARLDVADDVVSELVSVLDESLAWSADRAYVAVATEVMAESHRNEAVGERVAALQQTLFETLAAALGRARDTGTIDPEVDVQAASAAFLALVDGAAAMGASLGTLSAERRRAFLERLVRRSLERPA